MNVNLYFLTNHEERRPSFPFDVLEGRSRRWSLGDRAVFRLIIDFLFRVFNVHAHALVHVYRRHEITNKNRSM